MARYYLEYERNGDKAGMWAYLFPCDEAGRPLLNRMNERSQRLYENTKDNHNYTFMGITTLNDVKARTTCKPTQSNPNDRP